MGIGHDDAETRRSIQQSRFLNPFTDFLLREAGISEGMKVLDVGSGAGDVALLAAELVGPGGRVVGVDTNPEILDGFPEPNMQIASPVGGGPGWEGYENIASTIRSMLPLVLASGIATAEEVGIHTLAARLRAATVAEGGVVEFPDLVGAWTRKTG